MNNLFRNQFINNVNTKINTIKDIFIVPYKIYSNAKYNKKNKNDNNKQKYIPKKIKINKNNFKYKQNQNKKQNNLIIKNNLLKDITKDIEKDIHKTSHTYKEPIPKRIRELVWTTNNGETFSHKCYVTWCDNTLNVFNFQVGHDIPESKGGTIDIDNLKPICASCNLSMSNKYTITEWSKLIDMNSIKHIEVKNHKQINDTVCNNSDNKINNKPTLIAKIKNILPSIPSLSFMNLILNSYRYLKV
jgi:hypothetical protein